MEEALGCLPLPPWLLPRSRSSRALPGDESALPTPCHPPRQIHRPRTVDKKGGFTPTTSLTATARRFVVESPASGEAEKQNRVRKGLKDAVDRLGRDGTLQVDSAVFASLLRWCGNAKALWDGKRVHSCIIKGGFYRDRFLGNLLIQMYGKCGSPEDARGVFDTICGPNAFSWSARICAQSGRVKDGSDGLRKMPECDVVSWNMMLAAYARNGLVNNARSLFDKMLQKDVVSWNTMIAAYAQNGYGKEAVHLFRQMQLESVKPNTITFISILDAFSSWEDIAEGKMIHASIVDSGFEFYVVVGNALVNMYGKCGSLRDARSVFDKMPEHNVISWTAMIAAYAQNGHGEEALQLFQQMQLHGLNPNKITFISILDACASIAAIAEGKEAHASIVHCGFESDVVVATALVDMYGKSGSLDDARSVFDKIPKRDVVSWTAMIAAYAQNGHGKEALQLFGQMQLEGVKPNEITFINILSGCSHAGLLDDGRRYFASMAMDYGLTPTVKHYLCMIDLLGRAGHLDEAEDLINNMPLEPDAGAWMSLLGACSVHGDVERGVRAAQHIFDLDPKNDASFVLLSKIYSAAGRWDDAAKVRNEMDYREVKKKRGHSCIEVKKTIHEFIVGDVSHPQQEEIYAELQMLIKQMEEAGYVPDTKAVMYNTDEVNKERMLYSHSEKLAIAFGLISTPPGTPICITKNLRVCSDCHAATKFISKIVKRKIIVRDANCFHHFENGVCSCGDYW